MSVRSDTRNLFRALVKSGGDPSLMLVFTDALEEDGHTELADVYRWAAELNIWPFLYRRYERVGFLTGFGWGWFTACLATSIYFLFLRG
jgi:hypothetical protein